MNNSSRRIEWIVWGTLGLTITAIVVAFIALRVRESRRSPLPELFTVAPFSLTNQMGLPFGTKELQGHVWVAEIIFTRCAGPCPRMARRMSELQAAFPPVQPVRFITLTTDPTFDTPPVLESYGRQFQADPARWHFLTGTKQQIADAAVRSLKLTVVDKEASKMENPNDLFIHSTIMVVVDKQGRARAVVETEPAEGQPEPDVKAAVLPIIQQLLKE